MCGIAGIVTRDPERPVPPAELAAMVRTLRHRGPDDAGQVTLPGAGLGMRRLSIIDVAGGRQPFTNEDGAVHLVGNGEIYNHRELRAELVSAGHAFASASDVEVALHAYEEWGTGFVERLHGMFALALWDARSRTLVAARDRAGEKPLYYARTPRGLLLASEIKALLVAPDVSREVDLDALDQFLTYEYVITPRTIFSAVRRLPAAHRLVWRSGELDVTRYWRAPAAAGAAWTDDAEAAAALRETLGRAVARQMMSDVPLGAFLSGGIDSSAIVALMTEAARRERSSVNTFSMGFADGSYNELPHARRVAERFATCHREGEVAPDVAGLFDRLIVHLDEPFADVSLFPTFLVSELARAHVTVALSGDGGDELFGGYDAYEADRLARRIAGAVPRPAGRALAALASLLPPSEKKKGLVNRLKRFTAGLADAPPDIAHYRWMTYVSPAAKRRLYTPALRDALAGSDVYRPVRDALRGAGTDDLLNRQLYTDLSIYLADDILVKVDRMSMAASLETRAPFLDVDVMELAFSMPGRLKMRGRERKLVLKRALADVLPASILERSKEGFSIPMKNWLKRDLAPLMRDLLAPDRLRRRGWVEPDAVAARIAAHTAGRENHAHLLFGLMVLERWAQAFLDPAAPHAGS
ncbi:MAG: asparagine synthase (glutamine-hydrolyzing) [Acidobacteria bacterium]|nr:asparagine synthase (glutamine-hydrolyzing) [Acidobacteriota bacterium]